ncbi:WPP domain-associated protein [Frankliniella fusca]|uniref:WPP domain-associated protein n=1 Tax=Frankliniella fusca TaxID=407009 RepID=A0AAE1HII5_9NEOP|nr:WPP domain-associated protein [Frankliniella fusca]
MGFVIPERSDLHSSSTFPRGKKKQIEDRKRSVLNQKAEREEAERERYERYKAKCTEKDRVVELALSESGPGSQNLGGGDEGSHSPNDQSQQRQERGRATLMTRELADAPDYAQLSNEQAAKMICATAHALSVDVSEFNINRETIRRGRERLRLESANFRKTTLNADHVLTLHCDGKTFPALSNVSEAVIVTGVSTKQLLGAPLIELGKDKGKRGGEAVVKLTMEWDNADNIKALAFDTTSENTGYKGGAAVHTEQLLEKDLPWLPCRHHIAELVLEAVYHALMGPSKSPEIKFFKDFGNYWQSIDQAQFSSGMESETVLQAITSEARERLITFAHKQIEVGQPRADYLELLELSLTFLADETFDIKFRKTGPMHSARWMAKAIYGFKMSLLRDQLSLDTKVIAKLLDFSIFVVSLYVSYSFSATNSCSAPRTDLIFLQDLTRCDLTNKQVSQAAVNKFLGHFWYLSELSVGLSVFDEGLPDSPVNKALKLKKIEGIGFLGSLDRSKCAQ